MSNIVRYNARLSYGKDSLKMLDVIISRGLPLDRITTVDVWATDTIRAEHPKMVEFQEMADEYIWKKYRIEVEHLCATKDGKKKTYEQLFYSVPIRRKENKNRPQGTILGFPTLWQKWCTAGLKRRVNTPSDSATASKQAAGSAKEVEYIGIAADEPHRFGQLNEKKRAPLVEFGIDEGLCGLHCQYEDILSPSYEGKSRDGCWLCHNQEVSSLRRLRKEYPDLWELLLRWDADSPVDFKPNGITVAAFEERFWLEDKGMVPDDYRFRWSMLSDNLNYTLFKN